MAGEVAYVQLQGGSSRATLGLYAGMSPQELQQLVQVALHRPNGVCAGFQVSPEASNARSIAIPRLVPLSVACKVPELLTGRVSVLMEPSTASGRSMGAEKDSLEDENDLQRLRALLRALESELQLGSFEFAVLAELCEQQKARVLSVLRGEASVDEKRAFLLSLLRPEGSGASRGEFTTCTNKRGKRQEENKLQTELVAKKVAAIGRKVFSPQVQMQVLALADGVAGNWSSGRLKDAVELLELVEKLLDKHVLPEEHGAHLLELALKENRVLLSALQSYRNDGSWSDLETTAKKLAALGCDPPKPIASKSRPKKAKSPRRLAKQGSSAAKKRVRNAAAATPSAVSVVRSLHAQHMLTSLELDIVQALVAQGDSQVLQLLKEFERSDHRDVSALRDALVSIVEEITVELGDEEKAAAAFARGVDDAVREEEEEEGEDSDDDSDSLGWQRHVSFLLGQWQAQHQLTPADASTLRQMVAQKHNLLESAYEVFAGDGDGSELLDTLQRVAKLQRQIVQSQAGQNVSDSEPASDLSLEDVVRQMQRRGVVQAGEAAGLLMLFDGGNEALQAANEAFQADGDVRELEETLLLVVKHARFGSDAEASRPVDEGQAVSRLLAEYGRSGRLELWQIQLLMSLLKSHDPRLLAAVDVYNEDQNAEEFLETLEILVELAAWERHRRAMVHDWIAPLARSGKLPRGGAERLLQLVKVRDDRVVAALVVFLSDGNKEEFVDTLARIACLEAMKLQNVQADASQNDSKEGHLVLALLKELEDKGVMSGGEREQVEELVCSGEPRMLAAMDVLAATHDAEDFADTARRVLANPKDEVKEREAEEEEHVEVAEPAVSSPKSEKTTGEEGPKEAESASQGEETSAGAISPLDDDPSEEKEDESARPLEEKTPSDEPGQVEKQVVPEESEECGEAGETEEAQTQEQEEEVGEEEAGEAVDLTKEEAAEEVEDKNVEEEKAVKEDVEEAEKEQSGDQEKLEEDK